MFNPAEDGETIFGSSCREVQKWRVRETEIPQYAMKLRTIDEHRFQKNLRMTLSNMLIMSPVIFVPVDPVGLINLAAKEVSCKT